MEKELHINGGMYRLVNRLKKLVLVFRKEKIRFVERLLQFCLLLELSGLQPALHLRYLPNHLD